MKKRIERLFCGSLAWAIFVGPNSGALSQVLKLNCVQQSRHMCEQGKGCNSASRDRSSISSSSRGLPGITNSPLRKKVH